MKTLLTQILIVCVFLTACNQDCEKANINLKIETLIISKPGTDIIKNISSAVNKFAFVYDPINKKENSDPKNNVPLFPINIFFLKL